MMASEVHIEKKNEIRVYNYLAYTLEILIPIFNFIAKKKWDQDGGYRLTLLFIILILQQKD